VYPPYNPPLTPSHPPLTPYKAVDLRTNTAVALKKMRLETEGEGGISSSTLREITFLRQLRHENVVTLRDVR
jgi:serine/threonine protein kinase